MEHVKAELEPVLRNGWPVIIQDYLADKYSIYIKGQLDNKAAFGVLVDHFVDQDFTLDYFLFGDSLYKIKEQRSLDEYGYVEATLEGDNINIDAFWYNGGADFVECVREGITKLENELCKVN